MGIGLKLGGVAVLVASVAGAGLVAGSTYFAGRLGQRALDSSETALRAEASAHLEAATEAQLAAYDAKLDDIGKRSWALAQMVEQLLDNQQAYAKGLRDVELSERRKGFRTTDRQGVVSVISWPEDEFTQAQRDRIALFSHLHPLLARMSDASDAAQAVWTISEVRTSHYAPNRRLISLIPPVEEVPPQQAVFYRTAAPPANPAQTTQWTDVYLDPADLGLVVTVMTPFHAPGQEPETDRFAGVAGIDVNLSGMVDTLTSVRSGDSGFGSGFSLLVDSHGRLIAAPPARLALLKLTSGSDRQSTRRSVLGSDLTESGHSGLRQLAGSIAKGSEPGINALTLRGDTYMVSVKRMQSTGWGYINLVPEAHALGSVTQTREAIDASVEDMRWEIGLLTLGGVLLAVVTIMGYAQWSFVAPLHRLAAGVRRKGAGDDTVAFGSARHDELGEVTRAIDAMSGQIREQIETLEYRVAERTRELEQLARADPLTGLANRRYVMAALENEHERSQRYGRPLSLLMLDLDNFKEINDHHGHDAGDRVLAAVADFLVRNLREVDTVGRLGGEEFLILLPETDGAHAREVADRLCRDLPGDVSRTLDEPNGAGFAVTASFGTASINAAETISGEELLKRADDNTYRAKRAGRNCVVGWF